MRSVTEKLCSSEFYRLRLGIGRPESRDQRVVSEYVLGKFDRGEAEALDEMFGLGLAAVEKLMWPPPPPVPKFKAPKVAQATSGGTARPRPHSGSGEGAEALRETSFNVDLVVSEAPKLGTVKSG